jgi:hypothetical protein
MKTISRRTFAQAGALTALLLSPTVFAQANGFPDKPVRVIVRLPPATCWTTRCARWARSSRKTPANP